MKASRVTWLLGTALLLAGCQAAGRGPDSEPGGAVRGESAASAAASAAETPAGTTSGQPAAEAPAAPRRQPATSGAPATRSERPAVVEAPPAPTPRPVLLVPEGTTLGLVLESPVSSATSRAGDRVLARLTQDVQVGGRVALPAGTELRGRVTAAVPSGKVKGRARLAFAFDEVELRGQPRDVATTAIDITAGKSTKRDAAIIGGGAAGGAVIGGIAKGGKGAGIGALIGAGAGTAAVLATKGEEVTLATGTELQVKLAQDLRI